MTPCLGLPNTRTESQARADVAAKRAALALVKLSPTMEAIKRAVESLPPFPLSAPLPLIGTENEYSEKPCSTPRRRYTPSNTCWCGFLMGEHRT